MYPEPTELLLTGCLTESIWIQRFKSNSSTPKTNSQTLTKGNFTRDELNNLLHLCNISHFSSVCCSQNFSSASCPKTMAKRVQQGHGEERIVAKSKPTKNLVSHAATSSSTVQSPIASKSEDTQGTLSA